MPGLLRPDRGRQYVPNLEQRTVGATPRYQLLLLIGGAALVRFAAGMGERYDASGKQANDRNLARSGLQSVPIIPWIAIYVVFAIAVDFDATRDLAIAFALLLFVMTLITRGQSAATNIGNLVSHQPSFKPVAITGPDKKVN